MTQPEKKTRARRGERAAARAEAAKMIGRAFRCPDGLVRWITGLSTLDYYSLRWLDERDNTWFSGGIVKYWNWEGGEEVKAPQPGENYLMCGARGSVGERTVEPISEITMSCNCKGRLCEGMNFNCEACKREVPICRGRADAKPDDCDECWAKKQ